MHLVFCAILGIYILLITGGLFFQYRRADKFEFVQKAQAKGPLVYWCARLSPLFLTGLIAILSKHAAMLYAMHLLLFWPLAELIEKIAQRRLPTEKRPYRAGFVGIAFTLAYIGAGWFCGHHVFITEYTIDTPKALNRPYRVAAISDLHLGTILKAERLNRELERLDEEKPEALFVVGDMIDDNTSREQMEEGCRVLGSHRYPLGTYYVDGNHDRGYFSSGKQQYGYADFCNHLEANGVKLLFDASVELAPNLHLVGRRDKRFKNRLPIAELLAPLDPMGFSIVLDHQPNDYKAEAAAGADLVLSGHTHGGHVFPLGWLGLIIKANDKVYGHEKRENTDFIVSSGISEWEVPIKTGAICEMVLIDLVPAKP